MPTQILKVDYEVFNEKKPGNLIIYTRNRTNAVRFIKTSYLSITRGKDDSFQTRSFETILWMTKFTRDIATMDMGKNIIAIPMPIVLETGDVIKISRLIKGKFYKCILIINS